MDGLPSGEESEIGAFVLEKEAIETSLSNSHNNHLEKILRTGDEVNDREGKTTEQVSNEARASEYSRNRKRVAEIFDFVELVRTEIQELYQSVASS